MLSAHGGLEGLTKKNIFIHDDITHKNEHFIDEYEVGTLDEMEDYEQQICDTAQQPKISSIQARLIAMFDSIVGSLLVKMIVIKEIARHYCIKAKHVVTNCMASFNKNKKKIIKIEK